MRKTDRLTRENQLLAKRTWGTELKGTRLNTLIALSAQYGFSIALGDLILLNGKWYVTHAGLLRLACRTRCAGIRVQQVSEFCDVAVRHWVFKATVFKSPGAHGFVGYGDADPSNVSSAVLGAELRVAETRAVNRALRKAYGIGLCSVEELGSHPSSGDPPIGETIIPAKGNGSPNGQPRLRDKLSLLIRNYELDPTLVKRYANDFCGTETLREASRDLVKAFVATIAKEAANDLAALICKLNSYSQPEEVRP